MFCFEASAETVEIIIKKKKKKKKRFSCLNLFKPVESHEPHESHESYEMRFVFPIIKKIFCFLCTNRKAVRLIRCFKQRAFLMVFQTFENSFQGEALFRRKAADTDRMPHIKRQNRRNQPENQNTSQTRIRIPRQRILFLKPVDIRFQH